MVYGVMKHIKHKTIYRIVKSDKINALRQQYDAFVMEDKKRKERNEYILGRLDKMRYCTTLVPVRHKTIPSVIRQSTTYQGYQPEIPITRDLQPPVISDSRLISGIAIPHIDDKYLINEISKNYILIPKLRSPLMGNYLQPTSLVHNTDINQDICEVQQTNTRNVILNSNESNDWKSKYEILNILKTEEKNKQPAVHLVDKLKPAYALDKQIIYDGTNEKVVPCDNEIIPNTKSDSKYKYLDDFPEKDTPVKKVNDEVNDSKVVNAVDKVSFEGTDHTKVPNTEVDTVTDIDSNLQYTNLENNYFEPQYAEQGYYAESSAPQASEEQTNYEEYTEPILYEDFIPEENIDRMEKELAENADYLTEFKSEEIEHDKDGGQVVNSSVLMEEIDSDLTLPHSESTDHSQYATENINAQELTPNVDLQLKRTTKVPIDSKVPKAETENFDVSHEQQPYDTVTQQQEPYVDVIQQQTYIDVIEQQQPYDDVIEQQQPYDDVIEQQQPFDDVIYQQEPHADVIQQQFTDSTQQRHPSNEEVQQEPTTDNNTEHPSNADDSVDITGIEAFDNEQKEMFYSEEATQEDYQYNEPNANTYDQGYQQEVSYQQNQDYSYYENTDQAYNPVNLGENEEQTTKYDQAYQQQYIDPYEKAYAKQEEEVPPNQHEDIQQGEMEQLNQEPMHYQDYNSEQVETKLDSEEGYAQKPNKVPETDAENSAPPKERIE